MNHYDEELTFEEYQKEFENACELFSGKEGTTTTIASLPSLEGVVEVACGKDMLEARENYLLNIDNLLHELEEKKIKLLYDLVSLEYTTIGGDCYD